MRTVIIAVAIFGIAIVLGASTIFLVKARAHERGLSLGLKDAYAETERLAETVKSLKGKLSEQALSLSAAESDLSGAEKRLAERENYLLQLKSEALGKDGQLAQSAAEAETANSEAAFLKRKVSQAASDYEKMKEDYDRVKAVAAEESRARQSLEARLEALSGGDGEISLGTSSIGDGSDRITIHGS